MLKKTTYLFILIVFISSCKTKKNRTSDTNTSHMFTSKIIASYNNYSFNKKTIKATIKAKYKGKSSLPSVNVSLRIKKDEIIWVSISKSIFSLGKLKITPNRVQFYNKLQQEYFDGDFSLLSNFLGTEVNFKQVQKILLGEAIFNLNEKDYTIKTKLNEYEFIPKIKNNLFDISFLLNATIFKINKQEIRQEKEKKLLSITYPEYKKIDDVYFPTAIFVLAEDSKNTNTIIIDYTNVVFNLDLSYPFKIPNGYKEIKL
ncbi:MAG: DUF4292 domain-containing protein [Flavobacteriaceae bacterium]|nr:DUF4292 domain-containing protein [Flavobacteriaceae bacterium]